MSTMGSVIVLGFLLLILLFLFIPLTVDLIIRKNQGEDFLVVKLGIGPWQVSLLRINSIFDNWTLLINHYWPHLDRDSSPRPPSNEGFNADLPPFVTKFIANPTVLKKADLRHLEWSTRIGIANPAVTGIIAGGLWHLKHRLYRYLIEATGGVFAVPLFTVVPDFYETKLELEFRCIFAFRGGHIITAAYEICRSMLCSFLRGDKIEQPSH